MWDPTRAKLHSATDAGHFNPRVPCGTRHEIPLAVDVESGISIHGSRVGPDLKRVRLRSQGSIFQSTGPVWDPTKSDGSPEHQAVFQSTGPVWDPTGVFKIISSRFRHFNPRVPCGTRRSEAVARLGVLYFNPRVPCGTRL